MSRQHRRQPNEDDLALWEVVLRDVKPLDRRGKPIRTKAETKAAEPPAKAEERPSRAKPQAVPKPAPTKPAPHPPLAPMDRRMRGRVTRGSLEIDGRIDLHGLTQQAAHQRLRRYLADRQADGAKLVLVITGKGRTGGETMIGESRGILRRSVPLWLGSPEFRSLVIGFEAAGPRHGGEGALYVRLRAGKAAPH